MNSARQPLSSAPFAARARLTTASNEAEPLWAAPFMSRAHATTGAANAVAKTDALKDQKQVPVANEELLTVKLRYELPDADASTRIDQPVVAKDITPAEP